MRRDAKKIFVGIDESNHGKYPEYFAAVFSCFESDIKKRKMEKQRDKNEHQSLLSMLSRERDFAFLRVDSCEEEKLQKNKIGIVVASLIYDFTRHSKNEEPSNYLVFVDGHLTKHAIDNARRIVTDITSLNENSIEIIPENDDEIPILNYADEIAHFFFRQPEKEVGNFVCII